MLASQAFMTSVVVGKDIVPRIGLHQLEMLRHQLTGTLHSTKTAKVRLTMHPQKYSPIFGSERNPRNENVCLSGTLCSEASKNPPRIIPIGAKALVVLIYI